MMAQLHRILSRQLVPNQCIALVCGQLRKMTTENAHKCKILVLGGGTGGCTIASKFISKLGKNQVAIIEPADLHYYQPMLTMIGGGMKELKEASRPMSEVLPKDAIWIKENVSKIDAKNNAVTTTGGKRIEYEFLVVSLGLELRYDKIPGVLEALETPRSGVASNYSPKYVEQTYKYLQDTNSGKAIFTFPQGPVKCAGAPLKACLISEDFLRRNGKRKNVDVIYRTSLPVIFSVKHYADKLNQLCAVRGIDVGFQQELISVDSAEKTATFKNLANPQETEKFEVRAKSREEQNPRPRWRGCYNCGRPHHFSKRPTEYPKMMRSQFSFLHVTPPMSPPEVLKTTPELVDGAGFVNVNKETLQSQSFSNVYGIGDCTNLPTSKTAAAIAAQSGVLYQNLLKDIEGRSSEEKVKYDGYTSCPLVTGYSSVILAEFDYSLTPLETFPVDQSKEHRAMFFMKKDAMPFLYWNGMLKGYWNGPQFLRKILHFGVGR